MDYSVGIVGIGFVGSAIKLSFERKGVTPICYDKYKDIGELNNLINCDFIFLSLPTPMIEEGAYDKSSIYETLDNLEKYNYKGVAVVKSTVEPGTVDNLNERYEFKVIHNPEFLTERTAEHDFHNQKHIVLGIDNGCEKTAKVHDFFNHHYADAEISLCSSRESESMKLFCNNFYAMKIMIFNEFFSVCQKTKTSFENVTALMFKNGWINEMHTKVPGPDGSLGYGGNCFIKDTKALLEFSKRKGSIHGLLEATVKEREILRSDSNNIIRKD